MPERSPRLAAYLARIGWEGPLALDLATLAALHRAHAAAIPFENLDVQFGAPPSLDPDAIFEKLVTRRRGGWCYENNGLFGWALGEIGFEVTRVAGGVMRETRGDAALGNHLCLIVRLARDYLVDVGLGGVLAAPLPLEPGERDDTPYRVALERTADGYWRYGERSDGAPFTFDFKAEPADEARLAERCRWLATHPDSMFVLNLVVQRRAGNRHCTLRGRALTETTATGATQTLLDDGSALVEVLRERFGLDWPQAAELWDRVAARHEVVMAAQAEPAAPAPAS